MRAKDILNEDWQKVNKSDKTDGMSSKAVKAYRRENPGSKLKTAVTTKPSKLKKGSKDAKRRKSFCSRMSGMKKAHASAKTKRDPDSPINKALRRWNCESIEEMRQLIEHAEQVINEEKQRLDPKCWKGKHKEGTKIKGGVRVNNCVPNEGYQSIERTDKDDPYGVGGKNGTPMQIDIGLGGASKSSPGAQSGNSITKLASKLTTSSTKVGIKASGNKVAVPTPFREGLKDPKDNPCWKGYKPVGTKKKAGKTVPNCVPTESVSEGSSSLKPGWMLKKDTKLGAAVKAKQELAKKRQASYGDPSAGKSVEKDSSKIAESDLGTSPKRPARPGSRPERGHDVEPRYKHTDMRQVKLHVQSDAHDMGDDFGQEKETILTLAKIHNLKPSLVRDMLRSDQLEPIDVGDALDEGKSMKKEPPKPRNFVAKNQQTSGAGAHKDKKKADKQGDVKHKGKMLDLAEIEELLEKASRKLCKSSIPDEDLGASQLASCKSQGLRARDGEKSHLIGHGNSAVRIKVGGKRIKGKKYGGPLPDYGTRKGQ